MNKVTMNTVTMNSQYNVTINGTMYFIFKYYFWNFRRVFP
jgi:hypothetical protein